MTSSITKGTASTHSVNVTPLPVAKKQTQKSRYMAA